MRVLNKKENILKFKKILAYSQLKLGDILAGLCVWVHECMMSVYGRCAIIFHTVFCDLIYSLIYIRASFYIKEHIPPLPFLIGVYSTMSMCVWSIVYSIHRLLFFKLSIIIVTTGVSAQWLPTI